jgi:hypothetical protein
MCGHEKPRSRFLSSLFPTREDVQVDVVKLRGRVSVILQLGPRGNLPPGIHVACLKLIQEPSYVLGRQRT